MTPMESNFDACGETVGRVFDRPLVRELHPRKGGAQTRAPF